jgi:hypothetical protein
MVSQLEQRRSNRCRPHCRRLIKQSRLKLECETLQLRIKEKLGVHSAAELRQKAREWLARSAVNRIREDPESEQANAVRVFAAFRKPRSTPRGYKDAFLIVDVHRDGKRALIR